VLVLCCAVAVAIAVHLVFENNGNCAGIVSYHSLRPFARPSTAKMALISGATIITSLSLFHITLAFFFLTSPASIADQTLVFIIGEAMGLVSSPLMSARALLTRPSRIRALSMIDHNLFRSSLPSSLSQASLIWFPFLCQRRFLSTIGDLKVAPHFSIAFLES
jgi:hypothetical protein